MNDSSRAPVVERIAGAPISWGVSEVPDWGWQYDPESVLTQMREVGLTATEFGPDGFLPEEPARKAQLLDRYGLAAVGQFVPVVLHDPDHDPIPLVQNAIDGLVAARASTLVLAAATGRHGYDARPTLDAAGWQVLLTNVQRCGRLVQQHGLTPTLHPHVGTMVESGDETDHVLQGSDIGLCLDTGHLMVGGTDPVELGRRHPHRISHVHLKDVDEALSARVRAGEVDYVDAVRDGLFAPLGRGDVDVRAIVESLESNGYSGWYVLEQDTILPGPPTEGGIDPVEDVRTSMAYLHSLAQEVVRA